jgi:divalent metal cation (Fe/Co/Zn/Cd) transporter
MAGTLGGQIMPELRTPFGQQTAGLSATLAVLLAQEFDRAASRLVEENIATSAILADAQPLLGSTDLQERIVSALNQPPTTDYRVSSLQTRNDELRKLLIEVHAGVESLPGDDARAMNERIWDELRESTRRRHLVSMV